MMLNCVEVEGSEKFIPVLVSTDIHPCTNDMDLFRSDDTLLTLQTQRKLLAVFVVIIIDDDFTMRDKKLHTFTIVLYRILFPRVKVPELVGTNCMDFSFDAKGRRKVLDSSRLVCLQRNKLTIPLLPIVIRLLCKCMAQKHRIFDEGVLRITALSFIRTEQELELILFELT
jgi:hypothetical protein